MFYKQVPALLVLCVCVYLFDVEVVHEHTRIITELMVVEVTGRASCLGGAAAVHTSLTCQTGLDNK